MSVAAQRLQVPWNRPKSSRRLLLISYHFLPSAAAGALRWRKLAPLAAERGWQLDVVTLATSPSGSRSEDDVAELPVETRVFPVAEAPLRHDHVLTAVLRWARALVRRPRPMSGSLSVVSDGGSQPVTVAGRPGALRRAYGAFCDIIRQRRWAMDATKVAMRLAARESYGAVISCGPPHMAHVAAARVATAHGLPLIFDLRDPWGLVERLADSIDSPLWRLHADRRERSVMPRADLVVMNTLPARDAMRARFPARAERIIAVMNGFDEEQPPRRERPNRFTVTYTGSIYLDRDPRPLLDAARQVIERRRLTPEEFGLLFVGSVQHTPGGSTAILAQERGIGGHVDVLPQRPRSQLRELLAESAVLVSLAQDSHMAIPSKLFEYMQFDAWILVLAERCSAVARLLDGTSTDVVLPNDVAVIAATLERRFDQYRLGQYPVRLATEARFSRRAQATILFDELERRLAAGSAH